MRYLLPSAVSVTSLRVLWRTLDAGRNRPPGGRRSRRASSLTSRVAAYTTPAIPRLVGSFSSCLRPGDRLAGAEILRQRAEASRRTARGSSGSVTEARGASGARPRVVDSGREAARRYARSLKSAPPRLSVDEWGEKLTEWERANRAALDPESEQALARRAAEPERPWPSWSA